MHLISRLAFVAPLAALPFIPSVGAATIPQYVYDYGKYLASAAQLKLVPLILIFCSTSHLVT
jgi:hypothetical protein